MEECDCIKRQFKEFTLADIPLLEKYLRLSAYEESNHNLVNLVEWLDLYHIYYRCFTDYLLLVYSYKGAYSLYMPLCTKENFIEAIKMGRRLMEQCGLDFSMSCLTEEAKDLVLSCFPDLEAEDVRAGYDYIYDLSSFKSFAGKKLQKKRNHLNNFYKAYPNFVYEDIDADNLEEVKAYVKTLNTADETLIAEKAGILRVLDNCCLLKVEGGFIRLDGTIKALIITSVLSDRMVQENIEKADKEIVGLYQALLKEFFSRHYQNYTLLNREDDMGHVTLRQSKLSYHPLELIKKYRIVKREEGQK